MTILKELVESKEEKLIVKPTPGGGGSGISFIRRGDTKSKIANHLDSIKKDDIIIEKFLKAHPSYAVANPTSLNTLCIITFLYNGEISVIGIVFRMGATAKEVDNFTQGGVACGVSEDGICMNYGADHFGNLYTKHPNGFDFAGHQLYGVKEAVELVKNLHWRVPQFKQMSWDIAVVEDGTPTFIEMNPRGEAGVYQILGALPFGDKTEQILDEYLFTLYFKQGANWEWDYKEYADHIVLTGYGWNKKQVKVPKQINGKTVTHIADGCFTGNAIKKIIIPGCVKSWSSKIYANSGTQPEIVALEDTRGIKIPVPAITSGISENSANTITWEKVPEATSYYIYRMQEGGSRIFVRAVSACVDAFTDRNVLSGVKYFYYVRAHNSACNMLSEWGKAKMILTKV